MAKKSKTDDLVDHLRANGLRKRVATRKRNATRRSTAATKGARTRAKAGAR
jgi:hypothetical protein